MPKQALLGFGVKQMQSDWDHVSAGDLLHCIQALGLELADLIAQNTPERDITR